MWNYVQLLLAVADNVNFMDRLPGGVSYLVAYSLYLVA